MCHDLDVLGEPLDAAPASSPLMPPVNHALEAATVRSDEVWAQLTRDASGFRVLTGERTTGALHVGHYFGSLKNRIILQDMGVEMYLVLADYQALTDRGASSRLRESVYDIVLDYLGTGIDPTRSTIFVHSMLRSLNQLLLPFLSTVTVAELQRNPTVKDEITQSGKSSVSGMMMTYPAHQAADILSVKGNLVPGGKDQLPHLEVARDIAKRMNRDYFEADYFPMPDLLMSEAPLVLGLDGRKMGKSLNNAINLKMTADETAKLIKGATTDSDRHITYDPVGRPEVSNLVMLTALSEGITPQQVAEEVGNGGGGGLKKRLTASLNEHLAPIRERRAMYADDLGQLQELLRDGCERAEAVASETLEDVRDAMEMRYY